MFFQSGVEFWENPFHFGFRCGGQNFFAKPLDTHFGIGWHACNVSNNGRAFLYSQIQIPNRCPYSCPYKRRPEISKVPPTDSSGDAPRSTATCLWLSPYKTVVCLLIDWGTPDIRRRYRTSPVSASLSPSGLARGAKLVLLVVLCGAGLGPTFHAAPLVSHSTFREFAVNPRVKTLTRDE